MRSKLCLSLTLSVLFAPAHAAEDLLDAYRAAMTNDPRFQVAYYEYEAAKQAVPQARAQLLPGITLDLRGVETDQTIPDRDQFAAESLRCHHISSYHMRFRFTE